MTENSEAALSSQSPAADSNPALGLATDPAEAVSANFALGGDEAVVENPPSNAPYDDAASDNFSNPGPESDNQAEEEETPDALDNDSAIGVDPDPEQDSDLLPEAEDEEDAEEQLVEEEIQETKTVPEAINLKPISDKFFYKEMAKIKEKGKSARGGTLPPKKSASAYIIYQKEKRPEILKVNPKAKVTEVVKEIARCWSLMTKDDRMTYRLEAKRDKERYEKELRLLESQSAAIKKPKKCLSAYMIFVKETRPKIVLANPNMGALEVMQEVGRAWQSMIEADRRYFKDKADNDKHRYLAESRTFYDEVARVGEENIQKQDQLKQAQKQKIKATEEPHIFMGGDEQLAGKKRPPLTTAKKVLLRSSSMGGNKQRPTSSVMAIGLAPDVNQVDMGANISAQKRLRAESKFTFKPDEGSENNEYSRGNDFDNDEDDDGNDSQEGDPETAQNFFSKEFREILNRDYAQVRPSILRQIVKKRWLELTLKQKSPFELLSHQQAVKREEQKKAQKGKTTRARNSKVSISAPGNTSQLTRANQKLAKEALAISNTLKNELQLYLDDPENSNDQIQDNDSIEEINQNKQMEIDIGIQGLQNHMIDIDFFGASRGGWPNNLNRFTGGTPLSSQSNMASLSQQNQNHLAAQNAALTALALQNQYWNPQNAGYLQNNSQTMQSSQQMFGHQSAADDLNFGHLNSMLGMTNDQLQQQILHQMTASSQQQQQLNQQQLLLLMASHNLLNPSLNSIFSQQAAYNQLQQPQTALLNQNLMMIGSKLAAMSNPGQFNQIDLMNSMQQHNLMNQLHKNLETPQFAGLGSDLMGNDDMNMSALPNAATQPIHNIFYPTSTIDDQINFSNVLNAPLGLNQQQATLNTNAVLGGMQNSMFSQDFQLPASAHQTASFQMGGSDSATPQHTFGQDHKNNYSQHNQTIQLSGSPQISPMIGPLNNDQSNLDQSQLLWQQNYLMRQPMQKSSSSYNMLGTHVNTQKNHFNQLHQANHSGYQFQTIKDQPTMSASASNTNLLAMSHNNIQGLNGVDLLNNSTSVTPFLKPTERNSQTISSPFLKSTQPQNPYPGFNFASIMNAQQSHQTFSPLNHNASAVAFSPLNHNASAGSHSGSHHYQFGHQNLGVSGQYLGSAQQTQQAQSLQPPFNTTNTGPASLQPSPFYGSAGNGNGNGNGLTTTNNNGSSQAI